MTDHEPVSCNVVDRIATITLQRPEALNALDEGVIDGLREHLAHAHRSSDVGVVVIAGAGRAFCAGGDLRWFADGALAERGLTGTINTGRSSRRAAFTVAGGFVALIVALVGMHWILDRRARAEHDEAILRSEVERMRAAARSS